MGIFTEDTLVEIPTISLFFALGWQTLNCNSETSAANDGSSGGLGLSSGGLDQSSGGLDSSSGGLGMLRAIAEPVASKKKASKELTKQIISEMCSHQALSLEQLADLLGRSTEVLRKDYLRPLMKEKKLKLLYPTMPNHPKQAYETVKDPQEQG